MISLLEKINSKTWNQLKALGVNVCTSIIMDATKLLRKNNLVQCPQNIVVQFREVLKPS